MNTGRTITKQLLSICLMGVGAVSQTTFAATGGSVAAGSLAEFNFYVILASVLIGVGMYRKARSLE